MTIKAKIYKPAKTAMQSGQANTKRWLLVFESNDPKFIDPIMGWTGSSDTIQQLRMYFPTLESAIQYARTRGAVVEVESQRSKAAKPKLYADNFAFSRIKTPLLEPRI